MEQLLEQQTVKAPSIRFREFENGWKSEPLNWWLSQMVDCEHKTAPYVELSEYLVVRTSNVKSGGLDYTDIKCTSFEGFEEWTQRAVPEFGQILFTREAPAGESCLVPKGRKVCLGQRMVLLIPNDVHSNGVFLSYVLQSRTGIFEIQKYVIGTTVTRINIADIKKIIVTGPTLPEQQRIAAFLSLVDGRIGQLDRKRQLLVQYKKGIMQRLFSQQMRFKREDGSAYGDWVERTLGELGSFKGGGTPSTEIPEYWQGEIPWVSSSDISENDVRRISVTRFISEKAVKDSAVKIIPPDSLLFVARVGVGKLAVSDRSLATSQDFANFTPHEASGLFLAYFFLANNEVLKRYAQGTSIQGFTTGDLKSVSVLLPCLEEQQKIASFLSAIDGKIEAVGSQLAQMQQWKKGLLEGMFV